MRESRRAALKDIAARTALITTVTAANLPGVVYNGLRLFGEPSKQPDVVQQPWTEEDQQRLLLLAQQAEKYIHISQGVPIDAAAASRAVIGIAYARWGMSEAEYVKDTLANWYSLKIRLMTPKEQNQAKYGDGKVDGVTFIVGNDEGNSSYNYVLHPKLVELLKNPPADQKDAMSLILLSGVLYQAADALEGATFDSRAKTLIIFMASVINGITGFVLLNKTHEEVKDDQYEALRQLYQGRSADSISRRQAFRTAWQHAKVSTGLALTASLPAGIYTGGKRAFDFDAKTDEAVGSRDTTLTAEGQLENQPSPGVITRDPHLEAFIGNLIIPIL